MAGLVLAAAETPPAPPPKPVSPVVSEAPPKPKPSDYLCWQETPTGSHFAATMCETRLEMDARTKRDRKTLDPTLRGGRGAFTPAS
jgi:hypothetical protein